jgi:hypothetical protein
VEYLIKVIENNRHKLGFKLGLIIRLAKGVGIDPLIISLGFITILYNIQILDPIL